MGLHDDIEADQVRIVGRRQLHSRIQPHGRGWPVVNMHENVLHRHGASFFRRWRTGS